MLQTWPEASFTLQGKTFLAISGVLMTQDTAVIKTH